MLPINLELLSWIFAVGVALAAGALVALISSLPVEIASSLKRSHRIKYLLKEKRPEEFDYDAKLAGGINWMLVGLGAALALMLMVYVLVPRMPLYAILAAGLGFAGSMFARRAAREEGEWRVKAEIRDFLSSLRLSLAMKPTVPLALERTAQRMGKGVFARRLRYHVDTLLMTRGAMSVIEALSGEFHSKALEDLLVRLEAAKKGGLPLPEALKQASEEMELEMRRAAEFAVEDAPTKLTFPMLATLFPPLILLLILPMLVRLIKTIGELK